MMICFYLSLSILALPSLAVELNQNPDDPITTWIGLRTQIYNENLKPQLEFDQLKPLLIEISAIEQTDAYKFALKPLIESGTYRINLYKQLLAIAFSDNVLSRPDATITDLLLQTFDYDSNDCTESYFNLLYAIQGTFSRSTIIDALHENHELQYRNCWHRLMEPVLASYSVLGSRNRNFLDKLVTSAHSNELIEFSLTPGSIKYRKESSRIGRKIARFLKRPSSMRNATETMDYYNKQFERFVYRPCSLLINEMKPIMVDVMKLLKLSFDKRKSFISVEQALFLNTYNQCFRVLNDTETIKSFIREFIEKTRKVSHNLILAHKPNISPESSENAIEDNSQKTKSVTDDMSINSSSNQIGVNDNLITQQLIPTIDAQEPVINEAQIPVDESRKRKFGAQFPVVVKVDKCVGSGIMTRYPTIWSDGKTTMEEKEYLEEKWPEKLAEQLMEKTMLYRNRYKMRCDALNAEFYEQAKADLENSKKHKRKSKSSDKQDEIKETDQSCELLDEPEQHRDKNLRVIEIGKGIGWAQAIRYPTIWSDGSETMESKPYLVKHWPEQYDLQQKKQAADSQCRYAHRCLARKAAKLHEQQSPASKQVEAKPTLYTPTGQFNQRQPIVDGSNYFDKNRKIIAIDKPTGYGTRKKYPVHWSDGKVTSQLKSYLVAHYPEAWNTFLQNQKSSANEKVDKSPPPFRQITPAWNQDFLQTFRPQEANLERMKWPFSIPTASIDITNLPVPVLDSHYEAHYAQQEMPQIVADITPQNQSETNDNLGLDLQLSLPITTQSNRSTSSTNQHQDDSNVDNTKQKR